jgi:hypothetical protein
MAILRFFRLPKHQQWDYKPRYWDPKKEELEERLKRIEEMKSGDAEAMKTRISGGFRRGFGGGDYSARKSQVMRSNLILLGIIVVLVLLAYLFLTLYLPQIAEALGAQEQMH